MSNDGVNERVAAIVRSRKGPKRILACDGGGIRGLISVEVLAAIEAELRLRHKNDTLVLADCFHFVCGTSTGAIVAACISAGMSTDQLRSFYVQNGQQMFEKASILKRLWRYLYKEESLARLLRHELNKALGLPATATDAPALLGDTNLKTVLMMVMRNHTTDSPWFVSNNPDAKYNARSRGDCNLNVPLWQLVRASTAAPTYFPPEQVVLGAGTKQRREFIFVDGGITGYNNPAFVAFEMATAASYFMNWKTGADELLIVSVGTGKVPLEGSKDEIDDLNKLHNAQTLPLALMNAATDGWDIACRTLGDCRFGGEIDREVGQMIQGPGGKATSTTPKLFTYVRYDPLLTRAGLDALGLRDIHPAKVQQLDSVAHIDDIRRVGKAYADQSFKPEHLAGFWAV